MERFVEKFRELYRNSCNRLSGVFSKRDCLQEQGLLTQDKKILRVGDIDLRQYSTRVLGFGSYYHARDRGGQARYTRSHSILVGGLSDNSLEGYLLSDKE